MQNIHHFQKAFLGFILACHIAESDTAVLFHMILPGSAFACAENTSACSRTAVPDPFHESPDHEEINQVQNQGGEDPYGNKVLKQGRTGGGIDFIKGNMVVVQAFYQIGILNGHGAIFISCRRCLAFFPPFRIQDFLHFGKVRIFCNGYLYFFFTQLGLTDIAAFHQLYELAVCYLILGFLSSVCKKNIGQGGNQKHDHQDIEQIGALRCPGSGAFAGISGIVLPVVRPG